MSPFHSSSLAALTAVLLSCGGGDGSDGVNGPEGPASDPEMNPVMPAAMAAGGDEGQAPSGEVAMPGDVPTQEGPPADLMRTDDGSAEAPPMGNGSSDGDDVVEPPSQPAAPTGDGMRPP